MEPALNAFAPDLAEGAGELEPVLVLVLVLVPDIELELEEVLVPLLMLVELAGDGIMAAPLLVSRLQLALAASGHVGSMHTLCSCGPCAGMAVDGGEQR